MLAFGSSACAQQEELNTGTVERVSVERFEEMLVAADDTQLIDVRTDAEVSEGVIPGAEQMDITTRREFERQVQQLDRDRPVLIYCRSGNRSGQAAKYLHEQGFKEVYDLDGGIISWQEQGRKLVDPE